MSEFIIKNVGLNIEQELDSIGFDKHYASKAVDKYRYKNIKIFALTIPQANILKQTAISVGADCAVHRETITAKVEKTDCILGGSFSQLKKIAAKLRKQPFRLAKLADLIENELQFVLEPIKIKDSLFDFSRPYIVGILNLTSDSFSDGGEYLPFENAKNHLLEMINDGADIIDIGAESTKPFSNPVPSDAQLEKILPILDYIKENNVRIPISIDTRSAKVAKECIEHGADIINDVSGFGFDAQMAETIAQLDVPVVIQHSKGTPDNMQVNPIYENLIEEIYFDLDKKIEMAIQSGIQRKNIIVDPGIGFGKTKENNFEILNRLDEFASLKCPMMVGVSRKSLLGVPEESNEVKDIFSLALNSKILDMVNFIRVHNVKLHTSLLNLK